MDVSINNSLVNDSSDFVLPPVWMYTLPFQILLFILCVFGNTMVCVVVYRIRHNKEKSISRSLNNLLMLVFSMSVADLGVGIITMPISLIVSIEPQYNIETAPCVMQIVILRLCFGVSILTMVVISIDRYLIMSNSSKKANIKVAVASVWVVSCTNSIVSLLRAEDCRPEPYLQLCIIVFHQEDLALQLIDIFICLINYTIGIVSLSVFYYGVYSSLSKRMKSCTNSSARTKIDFNRLQRRTALMLIATVILFFICWTPLGIYAVIVALPDWRIVDIPRWISISVMWLAYLQSAVNPIVYSVGSKLMRQEFITTLLCFKKCFSRSMPFTPNIYVSQQQIRKNSETFTTHL